MKKFVLFFFLFNVFSSTQAQLNLWGMTTFGGDGGGVIFKTNPDGSGVEVMHNFATVPAQGPVYTHLVQYGTKLYGMTANGGGIGSGSGSGIGILFEYDPSTGILVKKVDFNGAGNGGAPEGSLTLLGNKFYGMTKSGGANGDGVLFEYDIPTQVLVKKIDFNNVVNGRYPLGSLTEYNGKLYGMTSEGGANDFGTLFEYNPITGVLTKKIDFSGTNNGRRPYGALTVFNNNLYGMTRSGGANNWGTLFEFDPNSGILTRKHDFGGITGQNPFGSLSEFGNKLYGMTNIGGLNGKGTLFEFNPSTNVCTKKIDFSSTNGENPFGSLTIFNNKFYGLTNVNATLFEYDPTSGIFVKKIDFTGPNGAAPYGSLAVFNSRLYGMTKSGGTNNVGCLFEYDPNSNLLDPKIHFGIKNEGVGPQGSLTEVGNNFYGLANSGSSSPGGVLFKFNPSTGVYTKKITFTGASNGDGPRSTMVVGGGKLFGTTDFGGTSNNGTLFEYDTATEVLTKKIDFNDIGNGKTPGQQLVFYGNKLYGLTAFGGINNEGTLFEYDTSSGVLTKKIDFSAAVNGAVPWGYLTVFNNKLYGMTLSGGTSSSGCIFEYDPITEVLTRKYSFVGGSMSGSSPWGSLTLYNSKLYGLTGGGGTNNTGILFEYDPIANTFINKINFDGNNGSFSRSTLTVSNGKLYGMAYNGGSNVKGTIFEFDPNSNTLTKKSDFDGINGNKPLFTRLIPFTSPGTSPEISVLQSSVPLPSGNYFEFGIYDVSSSSGSVSFTIENSGSGTLFLSGNPKITISGIGSGDFSINETITSSSVIAGGTTTFTVTFTPSSGGIKAGTLSIANNDLNENAYIINLIGGGRQTQSISGLIDINKVYGDGDFGLSASASSALSLSYASSNTSVATILNGFVQIVGAGTTTITASQTGSAYYYPATNVTATLTVAKALLTATANNQTKVYGAVNPSLTISYSGFVYSDNVSNSISEPTATSTATLLSSVAGSPYPISLAGGSSNNYTFAFNDGQLNIIKKTLMATADDRSKTYGSANPTFTISYSGFATGEGPTDITEPTASSLANASSSVNGGPYPILLTGGSADNYNLVLTNGELTVTKKTLNVTAEDKTKIYGAALPALTILYSGFVNGDGPSDITEPTVTTIANVGSPVAGSPYLISFLGGNDNNYLLAFNNGYLTVTKAPLTVTAENQTKETDQPNPTLTYNFSGFTNGESASVLTGTPSLSTSATNNSPQGSYPITIAQGTLVSENYDYNFVDGTLEVTLVSKTKSPLSSNLISVYPNPSAGSFLIDSPNKIQKVLLINSMGQTEEFYSDKILTSFKGLVLIKIETKESNSFMKIIIE